MERERKESDQDHLLSLIDVAFDIPSVGMGVQTWATKRLHGLKPADVLPQEARSAVGGYESNYLINPYVFYLLGERYKRSFPFFPSPAVNSHRRLILETEEEYRALFWQVARTTLAGGQPISVDDPSRPIAQLNDLLPYLKTATEKGLITKVAKRGSSPIAVRKKIHFYNLLSSLGFDLTAQYSSLEGETLLFSEFRPPLLRACHHKLGCMLAVTEQILYHANAAGKSIPASYRLAEQKQGGWRKMFGKEMPGIEGLYQEALEVLKSVADQNDPLVNYLFVLDVSKYLVK